MAMTREAFITAMGGEEKIAAKGQVVVECSCSHECCEGWNVARKISFQVEGKETGRAPFYGGRDEDGM